MKNRIIISLFLLAAFCAAPVFAQKNSKKEKPNFSGMWESRQTILYRFESSTTFAEITSKILVKHNDNIFEKNITHLFEYLDENRKVIKREEKIISYIFYTDGRGETNLSEENESVESSTKWDGKKLVITYKLKEEDHFLVSEYFLSKKADGLTVFTKILKKQTNPKNDKKPKLVLLSSWITGYNKVIE